MFAVYVQDTKQSQARRCFFTFKAKHKAEDFAKKGAEICKFIAIVIDDDCGKEISRFDYRPN